MPDLIDEIFSEEDAFYPGSKKKRRDAPKDDGIDDPLALPDLWREQYYEKFVGGRTLRLYTIGALADALMVSVPTIRLWVQKGYIPESPYRLPSNMIAKGETVAGRRLYPESVIDATVEVFAKYGLLNRPRVPWKDFPEIPIEIYSRWQDAMRELNRESNKEATQEGIG